VRQQEFAGALGLHPGKITQNVINGRLRGHAAVEALRQKSHARAALVEAPHQERTEIHCVVEPFVGIGWNIEIEKDSNRLVLLARELPYL